LFDIELLLAARELGVAIEEVPVCIIYNDFKSSVKLVGHSVRFLTELARIWRRDRSGLYARAEDDMSPERVMSLTEEIDA
jgi:hypothetical protein